MHPCLLQKEILKKTFMFTALFRIYIIFNDIEMEK